MRGLEMNETLGTVVPATPCEEGTEPQRQTSLPLPRFEIDCARHFLLRIASLPFRDIESLKFPSTRTKIRRVLRLERKLSNQREALERVLFDEVKRLFDLHLDDVARRMLELRRAIHNGRAISAGALTTERLQGVSPACSKPLLTYFAGTKLCDRYKAWASLAFEKELSLKRARLKSMAATNLSLQKGILLASRTLFKNVDDYAQSADGALRKRHRQTEQSLLAYVFRMAVRTTPFSHFAAVAPGTWDSASPTRIEYSSVVERTVVKPSLRVLLMITRELCKLPEVRERLHVRANRTLRSRSERLEFIKRAGEKRSLVDAAETVVSVRKTSSLEHILKEVSESPLTARDLIHALTRRGNDVETNNQARRYVDGLIDQQILETEGIVTEHSMNPLQDILAFLDRLRDIEIAVRVGNELREAEAILAAFSVASNETRARYVTDLTSAFRRAFEILGIPPSRLERNLLFEDAVLCSTSRPLNDSWFWQFEEDLQLLGQLRPLADSKLSDQLCLANVFKEKYGAGGVCADITEFWRTYLDATMGANSPGSKSPPPQSRLPWLGESDPRIRAGQKMANAYAEASQAGELEWNIDPALVGEELRELWRYYPPCDLAHNFFCQLNQREGSERLIFNSINPGWGKYLSRFCHLFYGENDRNPLLDSMREFVGRHCSPQAELCDILGTFSHNANLRPSITQYELDYPGVESGRLPEHIVSLSEIELQHDTVHDAVRLYSKRSGQEILPLHLGFLSHLWVPSFYRFLTLFGPGWGGWPINMSFVSATDAALCSESKPVAYFPRIVLGKLVLRRAYWKVATRQMPSFAEGDSDFECYLKLSRWWVLNALPSECLVKPLSGSTKVPAPPEDGHPEAATETDEPGTDDVTDKTSQRTTASSAKKRVWGFVIEGQYFAIDNFFSVLLLIRTLRSAPDMLCIEEMFCPSAAPVVAVNGQAHMTELVVEMAYCRK